MRKPRRSGQFDQRVAIINKEQVFELSPTFGESSKDQFEYSIIDSDVWCSVKYIGTPSAGASEDNIEDQRTGKSKIEIEMRYRNDVSHEDIIVYMGGWFEIYSIQEGGRDETTIIRAEMRDDDTFTLSVADGYTEDFYQANPLGYNDEPEVGNPLSPIALNDQWDLIGDKVLLFNRNESDLWRPSDVSFHMALPVDWFENRAKSGRYGQPGHDDRAKMLISIPEEVDLNPSAFDGWTSQSPSQEWERPGEIKVIDSLYIGANSSYPMVSIEVEMKEGKTKTPIPLTGSVQNFDKYIFPHSLSSSDSVKEDISRSYTRCYSIPAYESAGEMLVAGGVDILKTGNRYTPGISLRPFLYTLNDNNYGMSSFVPHYFGGSKAKIRIRGVIQRLVENQFENGVELEDNFFTWSQEDIDVSLEGAMPFVDLSPANIIRGLEVQLKSFPLTEEGVHDFQNSGTTTGHTIHSDYWRVKVEEGSEVATSKITVELRYDKFEALTPETVLGIGSSIGIMPINIYHRNLYGVNLVDYLGPSIYYYENPELNIHPSAFVESTPEKRNHYDRKVPEIEQESLLEQRANIALEDLRMTLKNFKLKLKRVVIPEEWEFGEEVSYEYIEVDLSRYLVENQQSISDPFFQNQCMGHRYVFDNIEEYVHDDDSSAFTIEFDVEYDIDKMMDDELVVFRSNDGELCQYEYNQDTGAYDIKLPEIENMKVFDDSEDLESINILYAGEWAQLGRKHKVFPYTTHFNLRQKNTLV
jgi:hypothetical protein